MLGALAPSSRGAIRLYPHISADSLIDLSSFSHLWIVFVFHTNKKKHVNYHGKSKKMIKKSKQQQEQQQQETKEEKTHDNENNNDKEAEEEAVEEGDFRSRGHTEKDPMKIYSHINAKVAPPRLNGKKVVSPFLSSSSLLPSRLCLSNVGFAAIR
jgi:hypothetical protein